jgi:hypothetical protein
MCIHPGVPIHFVFSVIDYKRKNERRQLLMLIDVQMSAVSCDQILIECRRVYMFFFLLSFFLRLGVFFFFLRSILLLATGCNEPCGYDVRCATMSFSLFQYKKKKVGRMSFSYFSSDRV